MRKGILLYDYGNMNDDFKGQLMAWEVDKDNPNTWRYSYYTLEGKRYSGTTGADHFLKGKSKILRVRK